MNNEGKVNKFTPSDIKRRSIRVLLRNVHLEFLDSSIHTTFTRVYNYLTRVKKFNKKIWMQNTKGTLYLNTK